MFKRLIASLTLDYEVVARGRGVLNREEMRMIVAGDRTKVRHAEKVLAPVGVEPTADDRIDLKECGLIVDHVEQMAEWIDQWIKTEIV